MERLQKALTMSQKIHRLTQRKYSPTRLEQEERERQILAHAREKRPQRYNGITPIHRFIIDVAADYCQLDPEEIIAGICDSDSHVQLLNKMFSKDGVHTIFIKYGDFTGYPLESGRFNNKLRYTDVKRCVISEPQNVKIEGNFIVAYRLTTDTSIEIRGANDNIALFTLSAGREHNKVVSLFCDHLKRAVLPALYAVDDFGLSTRAHVRRFFHLADKFVKCLEAVQNNIDNQFTFHVDHFLYKGSLLTRFQIENTAGNRERVKDVEKYFSIWLRQTQSVLNETRQLKYDGPNVGPMDLLLQWRKVLTKYRNVTDFVATKEFVSHFQCLKFSKAKKLVNAWRMLDEQLTYNLNKAEDNVKFIEALQKFWEPLYREPPEIIKENFPILMVAIRNVSKAAHFFNTKYNITSLFLKITNQLTIVCSKYLKTGKDTVWNVEPEEIIRRIETCNDLMGSYKKLFFQTRENMKKAQEKSWAVSPIYIFCNLEKFLQRLEKIKDICEYQITYSILDRIRITGMDTFWNEIKGAYKKISAKPYDPLNFRLEIFDSDYLDFVQDIENIEVRMAQYVKKQIEGVPLSESVILILKRYDKLNLDCLCMDRRYLDVAVMLENEIIQIRDIYSIQRKDPPIPRNMAPSSGRIMWIRSLQKRMDTPMKVIKTRPCVLAHEKAQRTVKYYNFMSGIILHYEMTYHKAWYDFVEEVRPLVHLPILLGNSETATYSVNLDPAIYQLMRETEAMWKLTLHVPDLANLLTYCKDRILNSSVTVKEILKEYEAFRGSINVILINIMRFQLRYIEIIFKFGLSFIKWTSEELETFLENLSKVISNTTAFYKAVENLQKIRVQTPIDELSEMMLVYIPDTPLTINDFIHNANLFREKIEREIELKSLTAEKATVDLINMFVQLIDFPLHDARGRRQFQLPLDEITEENWKEESLLPIDKYDWIQFEKINRSIWYVAEEHRKTTCFRKYEQLSYRLTALRNDCMDLFSFFNGRIISAFVQASKKSLDVFRKRIFNPNWRKISPVVTTDMEFVIPHCIINPSLEEIQRCFQIIYATTVDVYYQITTWGKQAKTEERKKRKMTMDEISYDKTFFRILSEHKDITRAQKNVLNNISMFRTAVDAVLEETYDTYKYLWAEDREDQIRHFINSELTLTDIREKFKFYDRQTTEFEETDPVITIGPIEIRLEKIIHYVVEASKKWKVTLGRLLNAKYKIMTDKIMDFIMEQDTILTRPIVDLDDVRIAMDVLQKIRENFIETDAGLNEVIEIYAILQTFNIEIPKEDYAKVENLEVSFRKMYDNSQKASRVIDEMQIRLLREISDGIEVFVVELNTFNADFEKKGPMQEGIGAKEAADRVSIFQGRFDELWRKYESYNSGEKLFGLPVTEYPILHQRGRELNYLSKLYSLYVVVLRTIDSYSRLPMIEVDMGLIGSTLQDFQNKCRKLPKGMQSWPAYIELKSKIDSFNEMVPLLEFMSDKAVKDRHWAKLNGLFNTNFDYEDPEFTLGQLMEAPILNFREEIEDICFGAVKEMDIEAKLKQIISDWSKINLQTAPFKIRGDLLLKGSETADTIALIEDSLMIMNSLAMNRYNAPFKKEILLWLGKLNLTAEILEKWLILQNLWMYLEAVFVGGDISKQLPAEAKRFNDIDKRYVKIMLKVKEVPNAVEYCATDENLKATFTYLIEQLEDCQKSLSTYLETKRKLFPRFYFVSDPVLLEILGQASDPRTIQPHLLSVFDAIASVDFREKTIDYMVAMNSSNGEKVYFDAEVHCNGPVERWLGKLLKEMQETVKFIIASISQGITDPDSNFLNDFPSYFGQGALVGLNILWTRESEYALRKCRTDPTIMKRTNQRFTDILNFLIDLTVMDLSNIERIRYETMVTIHVHQKDIFDDLVRMKIRSPIDFEWQKQSRFYFNETNDEVLISITDVNFIYQDEYLGVTERLAITPLTDKCYITLAQAIGLNMGGLPAGPAGTGKTETTKDMGRALGKFVIVFNCSDQMDFRGLGRIYKGLAQSGCWGCFDEFNRIDLPVLSVAAQQVYIVLLARKEKKSDFIFSDGDKVAFNPEVGIILTMNPGYAGRQELPENLKILFRTVAMMVPDRQIIIRVKMASCGFKENVWLSRKFYTLYFLCEQQLSKQVHYDFGLRNILSVLRTLGAQKRANPEDTEEIILMRVLRDMNLSKLIDEDEPLFLSLIEDMFPGVKLTVSSYRELQRNLSLVTQKFGYINNPEWNLKVIQLYEIALVRHGVMLMGPTGSGKTSCIHGLLHTFTLMGKPHREMRMNPKAITAPQMFGRLDAATNDWTDGIFSTLWRRTLKMKPNENCWIVLDGPVDAVWIENLNSVLDDNKTLTLANGDRIKMVENCKLVFEPDNVDNASPATISRVGIVFLSSSVLKWRVFLEAWLKSRPNETEILRNLYESVYDDAITFVATKLIAKMNLLEAMYIQQMLVILDGLLDGTATERYLERMFIFALMWSLGAVLELPEREKLEDFLVKHPSKLKLPKKKDEESIFEFFVEKPGVWVHWSNKVDKYAYPDDSVPEYASILIPNVDNVRTAFLIDTIAKQKKHVLLIGEQGTAKTVIIKGYLSEYDPELHLSKSFNFSSATTPNMYQRTIESYVEKRVGTIYGPPGQKRMTIFIDDINMPVINEWGDQITNEIVRQMLQQGGFYSLDKPGDFLMIADVQLLAAMIHPGGGRNDIPNRLKRQFCIFNCTLPSDSSMDQIFGTIGKGYFCSTRFKHEIVKFIPLLIPLTRIFWQNVKIKMLPTPAKFHYIFNLRDLSRIWEGILSIRSPECPDIETLLLLWRHECIRVIADRFVDTKDKKWFHERMRKDAEEQLGEHFEKYDETETYFVDFLRDAEGGGGEGDEEEVSETPKVYEHWKSYDIVAAKVSAYMNSFNETVKGHKVDLVLFHEIVMHLMIISRIVRTPRGNALLVAVGGSGKRSLAKLGSFIAQYKFHSIILTRTYTTSNLIEDFKYLFATAGYDGQGICFIFQDTDVKEEGFLEYINNVLSSGEIAGLFMKDELDEMLNNLVPVMKKQYPRRIPTHDNLYDYFITRARSNLHLILCFSPIGEKFRSRSLKFPGLISGCTVDWFQKWPEEGLIAIARHYLDDFDVVQGNVKENLILISSFIYESVSQACIQYYERFRRSIYVSTQNLITYLIRYKTLYYSKREHFLEMANRMSSGLYKLDEAAAAVEVLKVDLIRMNKEIVVATEKAERVLEEVANSTEVAEIAKTEVSIKKAQAEDLVEVILNDKAVAEAKLEKAKPALEEAEQALKTIKAADIATVRKLGKPPYLITLIMDCVLIYFGKKLVPVQPDPDRYFLVTSWSESLKLMADVRFLMKITEYPTDSINEEMIDLLSPYFRYNQYNIESARIACGNVAGLLQWTIAMSKYFEVNKDVLPLKANLAIQEAKFRKASMALKEAEDLLAEKEAELERVQRVLEEATQAKENVLEEANRIQHKMDTATALIEGLGDEKVRWKEQISIFKSEVDRLVGDAVYLAAFLIYTGPFNQEFRANLLTSWYNEIAKRKVPLSMTINLIDSFTDRTQIGEWNLQGLPTDDLSIQNGIIANTAKRCPLLIDPQSQGKMWIKNKEKVNDLIITTLNHKLFRNQVEECVASGLVMLIEDIGEELDPSLLNVLNRSVVKIAGTYKIKIGDKEVEYNENYRLFMTTKIPNPSFPPEIYAKCAVIDFTVTRQGLEDQLLGRVIVIERRELEEERTELIETVTRNLKQMKQLEVDLLHKLSTVQGSLLDDITVVEVLNTSKSTAIEIKEKLITARETEEKINIAREEYRPVATRGSILYFIIVSMPLVNFMYQTSLVQFLERFDISLALSKKTQNIHKRIAYIIEYLTYEVYRYQSRGVYEAHKYLFLLLTALSIDLHMKNISFEEFQTFIKGGAALNLQDCPTKPYKWISDEMWLNVVQLSTIHPFTKILQMITEFEKSWKSWFQKGKPEEQGIPEGLHNLDPFKKLLLIRAWCSDRTMAQSRFYIKNSLGEKFLNPIILNFEELFAESRPLTPMICFLSMGSDPSNIIEIFAKRNEMKCYAISMGQGQEVHSRKLMNICLEEGGWLLIQNAHLGLEYMEEVIRSILDLERAGTGFHDDFRLWITTEGHPKFPITLLQQCIKFTNEPPTGLRAGLKRTYTNLSQDLLDYSESPYYLPLIWTTSFLYSVLHERRRFGPLGWNIPYEFNLADWLASCMFIQNHLDDLDPKKGINWTTVRYMLGEIHFGGRITDEYDSRLLSTFCKVWYTDALFNENFEFYKGYPIFKYKIQEEYLEAIETMNEVDPPEVLGFHANADITYQTSNTKTVLDIIVSIQPKESSSGGGVSREENVSTQANDMLKKLPPPYNIFAVRDRIYTMGHLTPLNIFLRQEIDRMQKILLFVKETLTDLLLALEGIIIMSDNLRDAFDNVFNAKVPVLWRRYSWESSSIGFWFTELIERNNQFYNWCFTGRPPVFWLPGFFNPQGFLTGMKQEVARAHKGWALDEIFNHNEVLKSIPEEIKKGPKEGVYIFGLFLDGAGWDKRNARLVESTNKILFCLMPVIHMTVVSTLRRSSKNYECPVYKKIRRTGLNFICPIWLESNKSPEHWIVRGVALLGDTK